MASSAPVVIATEQTGATIPNTDSKGVNVRQAPADLLRCSFAQVGSGLLTSDLTLLQTGGGMAVSQSAGNLVVTTGTTANSETLMRSSRTFNGAFTFRHKMILSQRIANNNFSVELADLIGSALSYSITNATTVVVTFPTGTNPFTSANVGQFMNISVITGAAGIPGRYAIASVSGDTVTYTVASWPASGSGTLTVWGWNYHRMLYTGVTATQGAFDCQRKGWASGDTVGTIQTTASPGLVWQIQNDGSMVGYSDSLVASSNVYQFTARGSRVENIPDPNDNLYLFIRVLNGTTAPASTTTMTIGFVSVEEHGNNRVYINGVQQSGGMFSGHTQISNTPGVVQSGTWTVQPGNTANTTAWYVALGARTTNGTTTSTLNSAATTNATNLKASAGAVYGLYIMNTSAATKYVRLFNKASAPTPGTDTPIMVIAVPATSSKEVDIPLGIVFSTGIGYTITNAAAVLDATAVAAGDVQLVVTWI